MDKPLSESTIFDAALAMAEADRASYLESACGGDAALRTRVERLLAAHADPDSFLDDPAAIGICPSDAAAIGGELDAEGHRIGPYKLLQQIGEGGMGLVYMAEQTEPVRRRVALKIIKPGMDTREVIARFEAERQALALMDHPNIARVLDAGTTQHGRPYFVMELVKGRPITEYCNERHLSTRERLELFAAVCRGVQHAHQKGVIHRDLKPSNILIAQYDHEPVPKVIDFGVSKAVHQQLTERTLFTKFGQLVGTLDYMSPEQAKHNQLDIDTRSDVYSLGIVLYELLTGETPFGKERLRSAAFDEVLKIIRDEEPLRPSVKLGSSARLSATAAERGVDPKRLTSLVRGDLDWIVLKTLAKDRSERYATAQELGVDVLRHLNEQSIAAGPPRPLARAAKFARRHRRKILVGAVLFALISAGLAMSQRAKALQHEAMRAALVAREQSAAARAEQLSRALETASASLGQALESRIGSRAEWDAAERAALQLRPFPEGDSPPEPLIERVAAFHERFSAARKERQLSEQLEGILIKSASRPDLASWEQMELELRNVLADQGFELDAGHADTIATRLREHAMADRLCDALELWIATRGRISALGGSPATSANMQPWADALLAADGDPRRSGIRRLIYSGVPPSVAQVDALAEGLDPASDSTRIQSWLAATYTMAGSPESAERILKSALNAHPADVMLNFNYGMTLARSARWPQAARMYARATALRPDAPGLWQSLGLALQQSGELENALDALTRACELDAGYAPTWMQLGELQLQLERYGEALESARQLLEIAPNAPEGHGLVGRARMKSGQLVQARTALRTCVELSGDDEARARRSQWLAECEGLLAQPPALKSTGD